jgi:hypothetical protein
VSVGGGGESAVMRPVLRRILMASLWFLKMAPENYIGMPGRTPPAVRDPPPTDTTSTHTRTHAHTHTHTRTHAHTHTHARGHTDSRARNCMAGEACWGHPASRGIERSGLRACLACRACSVKCSNCDLPGTRVRLIERARRGSCVPALPRRGRGMRLCDYVVVWSCGCVVVWLCGCVVVWLCGCVRLREFGSSGL